MANIVREILEELGGGTMNKVGTAVGLSPAETESAVSASLPALISGLATNASQPAGAEKLATALDKNHGPSLLSTLLPLAAQFLNRNADANGTSGGGPDLASLLGAAANMFGGSNAANVPSSLDAPGILGHIFGGNTSGVTDKISKATGLDSGKIGKILLVLAPIVMSALANMRNKRKLSSDGLAASLRDDADTLGAPAPANTSHASEGGFMDKLSDMLRGRSTTGGAGGVLGDLLRSA